MPKRTRSATRTSKRRRPYGSASKRTFKKRRYSTPARVALNQPSAYKVLLQERYTDDTAMGAWTVVTFGANDRVTTMANWSQYSAMFSKYRVDSFTVSVSLAMVSTGSRSVRCYIWGDDKATCATEAEALKRPYVKARMLPADNSIIRMRMKVRPWTLMGITKQHYFNDDYYSASTAGSPSKLCYVHVAFAADVAPSSNIKLYRIAQLYKFYNRVERT